VKSSLDERLGHGLSILSPVWKVKRWEVEFGRAAGRRYLAPLGGLGTKVCIYRCVLRP